MADTIHLFNGSRRLDSKLILEVMDELKPLRDIDIYDIDHSDIFVDMMVDGVFEPERNQCHYMKLLKRINNTDGIGNDWYSGKIIVLDPDIYSDSANNWCFGGFKPMSVGLGYVLISTARLEDEVLATHMFRHEIGHMFGSPSKGRTNTEYSLGPHCTNDLCVMQQKLSVSEAKRHAYNIKDLDMYPFCRQCMDDIRSYVPPSR